MLIKEARWATLPRDLRRSSRRCAATNGKTSMTRPTPRQIKAMAEATGVPVVDDVAARIANSIGPAFEGFAAVAGTLPFDLEPATFLVVQKETAR